MGFLTGCCTADTIADFVDYEAVRADIKALMDVPEWDDGSYGPLLIRLAWHSSGTYSKVDGTGGSGGATMRLEKGTEAADPENAGLDHARKYLQPIKDKYSGLSYSDMWILAAYVAIEHMGGPTIDFQPGRKDVYEIKKCPVYDGPAIDEKPSSRLPHAEYGLVEGTDKSKILDEEGRIKGWENLAQHMRDVFFRMGFDDREIVALMTGGHLWGRCHPQHSGYAGAWVEEPTKWSNEYAKDMTGDPWRLVTNEDTWLDEIGAAELRPAPGKRQYVNRSPPWQKPENYAPNAKEYPPGQYAVVSGWVNARREPDTSSDIIGRPQQDEVINITVVKLFETAIRGRLDCGGWVSLVATRGKKLFERKGDLQPKTGTYRTLDHSTPTLYKDAKLSSKKMGNLKKNEEVKVTEVKVEKEKDGSISLWAKTEKGWFQATSKDGNAAAERVQEGWNDKPQEVLEDEPEPNQMMLVADMVLLWDPIWKPVLEEYAEDETGDEVLRKDFAAAYKKLTELGVDGLGACPFAH